MIELEKHIKEILLEMGANKENRTPLMFDIQKSFGFDSMRNLVIFISENFEEILKKFTNLIEDYIINSKKETIYFSVNSLKNANKSSKEIVKFLDEHYEIKLSENELEFSNEYYIKKLRSIFLPLSENQINNFFETMIGTYDFFLSNNEIYLNYKKSFIIAYLILKRETNNFLDPLSEFSNDYTFLKQEFSKLKLDLTKDEQFLNYKLLSIENGIELLESSPARVYDSRVDHTFFLNGIDDSTYQYLLKLYKQNSFNLSLKPSSLFFSPGKDNRSLIIEHLETGQYFDIKSFGIPSFTKLYDSSYDNTLWITIDGKNLTFEELLEDFLVYKDLFVTQVVHSQYQVINDILYITHLDHEFIFYDFEEYNNRQNDFKQKGEARKRIKTFKIDKSKIRVDEDHNILFEILMRKFKKIDLLKEYFNKIIVSS